MLVLKVWVAGAKKGTKLKVRAGDPLQVLFDGYCRAKKVQPGDKARATLHRRPSLPGAAPLDLSQSAAAAGLADSAEIDLVVG